MESNLINVTQENPSELGEEKSDISRGNGNSELNELRNLLVQPEQVGDVLPEAISASAKKSKDLSESTLPIVEENILQSARRRPEILAEALFPVIGPAIRKAIAEALSKMVQSMNQTMENSLSPKGLKWRIEALRTGKPFAEVVMLHSLVYRVEDVFLIHKETGLLLKHVSESGDVAKDADMVSAMLTAIQDFVNDSFKASENATLDSLQIKELAVWMESGPDAVLAAVIRGNPPLALRETLAEAVEEVHATQSRELDEFDGEASVFERSHPILERCLQSQVQEGEQEKKGSIFSPTNVLAGVFGLLLLIFGFFYVRDYMRWSGYVSKLKSEPGIVVAEAERGLWRHSISGLRDPLAADPDSFLKENGYDKDDVESQWKPYQDLGSEMILARAKSILKPPDGIKLSFEAGILTATGSANPEWFENARRQSVLIPGINEFKTGEGELAALKTRVESQYIRFNCGTTDYSSGEEKKFEELSKDFDKLAEVGNVKIDVIGVASLDGSDETNAKISQARADKVQNDIFRQSEKLRTLNESNPEFLKAAGQGTGTASDCKVIFAVK